MHKTVIEVVTDDEFELPVGAYDTVTALANAWGVQPSAVRKAIAEHRCFLKKYRIYRISIEEEDE